MSRHLFWRPGFFLIVAAMLINVAYAGTTGKLRGKVTDKQTGEPLVGASVLIEGTMFGASTDVNGIYIILNIQSGIYKLKVSYLGYRPVEASNVAVNIDLTTEQNFSLSSEGVQLGTVQIVAEAPLVNKSATNQISLFKSEDIENMPVRGIQNVFALSSGVVSQGGNLFVRGGRTGEVAFYVDGVAANNPMNRQSTLNVITNAIEEVSAQIGGMTAEYGNALSGVVNTATKIGTPKYAVSAEAITDGFLSSTKKVLNTYSYGLNEYVITASGPVIPDNPNIRFFVAGQRIFNRSQPSFLDGIQFPNSFDSLQLLQTDYIVTNRDSGKITYLTPGTTGQRGHIANLLNSTDLSGGRNFGGLDNDSYGFNGNVYFDLKNFNIKVGGTFNNAVTFGNTGKALDAIEIAAGTFRPAKTLTVDGSMFAKFTQILDQTTYYTLNLSYYSYKTETGDAILFRDYAEYGDQNNPANWQLVGPSKEPGSYQLWGWQIPILGHEYQTTYTKGLRQNISGRGDFVKQFGKTWELKIGGEATYYTLRTYSMPGFSLALAKFNDPTASDWKVYNNSNVSFYGYDIYGNEFNGGNFTDRTGYTVSLPKEGPRHPLLMGGYIQNKIELSDLIVNIGARLDYIDPGSKKYKNTLDIGLTQIDGIPIIADTSLVAQDRTFQVSPRLGLSFPVTDKTVFHAEFGKFIAQAALNDLYDTRVTAGRFLQGGFARQFPSPNLKPERTTDYQLGFRQQVGEVAAFDLSFFYKDTKDLVVIRQVYPQPGAPHGAYISNVNGDFGTVRGLSFRFDVRRLERISLNANYTFQSSLATGSNSRTNFDVAWQDVSGPGGTPYFPVIPAPTDFDRTHFGNISLDYRYAENDGPTFLNTKILERLGANFLFSFSSGRRYTKQQIISSQFGGNAPFAYETANASTAPWIFELDLRLNKVVRLGSGVDLDVYLWVTNLLDTKNIINVYPASGQANVDGYFAIGDGQSWQQTNGADARKLYDYLADNNANYGTPRVLRLGAKLNF